jgi:ankyrin repeat protein
MKAALKLSPIPRYEAMRSLLKAGLPITSDLHVALGDALSEDEIDARLVHLLLHHGASPMTNCCKALVEATRRVAAGLIPALLDREISEKQMSWIFSEAITQENAGVWFTDDGLQMFQSLLAKGARGDGPNVALTTVLQKTGADMTELADKFVDILLEHGADVNYGGGVALQMAASMASAELIAKLLKSQPSAESVSAALPHVFDKELNEDEVLELIALFTNYSVGESALDVMLDGGDSQPILFKCLAQHPRSTKLVKALLDAGYYYDPVASCQLMADQDEEAVSLLMWALLQPQKRVSSGVIELLIQCGAKINFETRISRTTPLMLAIQARRPEIVKMLLLEGAEVDIKDAVGNSPLSMATQIGGDLSTTMMSNLLAADAPSNDGSLHNAARELNFASVQVLVQYQHDPDFPSTLHGGRTALGELCLHAADSGELTAVREKAMEKVMTFLIGQGTDVATKSDGRSVLLLALESADPVTTTRLLLKVGQWKSINKSFNTYTDGNFTYSPTVYVSRVLPPSDYTEPLLTLLRANRAEDAYYANSGPQPEDAVGLPEELEAKEREREARRERLAALAEEHNLTVARTRDAASVQQQIWAAQAEMEDTRRRRLQHDELSHLQARTQAEEEAFNALMRRRKGEQAGELAHHKALADAQARQARLLGAAELEVSERKQGMLLTWEKQVGEEKLEQEKALSAVRQSERSDVDRVEKEADKRFRGRIAEQKRLVESQTALAGRLAGAGVNNQRQIGYITGELN